MHTLNLYTEDILNLPNLNKGPFYISSSLPLDVVRFTGCGKRGWDKTRLHLEWGRHSFLWLSDELSELTCEEFGIQNLKQREIFSLLPFCL